jgi:hypothetical protein
MADIYTTNYQAAYVDVPADKFQKGELAGRKRMLYGKVALPATLADTSKIFIGKLPGNSIVTNASIRVEATVGAVGTLDLGHGATSVDVANADAFIAAADCSGQAVLARPTLAAVGMYKRFEEEVEIYATCNGTLDGSTAGALVTAHFEVEYVND